MNEQVEWIVCHVSETGLQRHTEGAQSVFGLTTAKKIAKQLGPPWVVNHYIKLTPPEQSEQKWSP